jgi:hypothetical protein
VDVVVRPIPIPTDEASAARGEPLTGGPVFAEPRIAGVMSIPMTGP